MPVLVMCQDSDQAPKMRKTHLQAHLDYMETVAAMVCVAGPLSQSLTALQTNECDGSCFIYDTEDLQVARKLLDHDPYSKAGVYSHVAFAKFAPKVGNWIGGVSWK